jgi:MADS-box transcription factor
MNVDTPVSALPSRFLGEYLASPSGFYSDLFAKGNDSNTLSPLNFGTPVGPGPSFLRDDPLALKRKSPDITAGGHQEPVDASGNEAKRVKVDH